MGTAEGAPFSSPPGDDDMRHGRWGGRGGRGPPGRCESFRHKRKRTAICTSKRLVTDEVAPLTRAWVAEVAQYLLPTVREHHQSRCAVESALSGPATCKVVAHEVLAMFHHETHEVGFIQLRIHWAVNGCEELHHLRRRYDAASCRHQRAKLLLFNRAGFVDVERCEERSKDLCKGTPTRSDYFLATRSITERRLHVQTCSSRLSKPHA